MLRVSHIDFVCKKLSELVQLLQGKIDTLKDIKKRANMAELCEEVPQGESNTIICLIQIFIDDVKKWGNLCL